MNSHETCPNAESLVGLLDSQLPEVQQEEITEHVNSCETCQQSLESLVTYGLREDLDFENVGEYLRQGIAEENTLSHAAKQRLTSVLTGCTTASSDTSAPGISLDFLNPSEHKDSLGSLGQFEITEVIGRGGMGVALKARDTRLERVVAIKVLAPELAANPTARKRFLREAQSAAAVSHDHVVTTFAVEPGELPYLAMEYIDGQSLQQKIDREAPLPVREILRIGMQTAYGLAAAHAQGLIHRDIKPSNILLQNSVERVQITDFGLARAVDDVAITRTGEITGTPQYMSPEQTQGLTNDHRADLFSLGCVLYAMCTGRSPFRAASTMAVINRVCNDQPQPIPEINADIPGWLAGIIDRLLEKDPANRYQTAAEVADLLSQCLAHVQQPVVVPLPEMLPATNRIKSSASRRPKWYVGAILLAVLFSSLGMSEATGVTQFSASVISIVRGDGTLVVEVNDPGVSITIAGEDVVITGAGPREVRLRPGDYHIQAEKDGKPVALEQQLISISRGGRKVVSITAVTNQSAVESDDTQLTLLRSYAESAFDISLSAAGDRSLSSHKDKQLKFRNLSTGKPLKAWTLAAQPHSIALTPNGLMAAAALSDRVELYDVETLSMLASLPRNGDAVWRAVFSPDGSWLATRDFHTLQIWSVADHRLVREFQFEQKGASVAFSPDSKSIAYLDGNMITFMNIAKGDILWTAPCESDATPWYVECSPCGRFVVNTVGSRLVELRSAKNGSLLASLAQNSVRDSAWVAFTPDGENVLWVNSSGHLQCWSTRDFSEVFRAKLDGSPHRILVSPDGRSAWTCDAPLWDKDREVFYQKSGVEYATREWQLPESVWPQHTDE